MMGAWGGSQRKAISVRAARTNQGVLITLWITPEKASAYNGSRTPSRPPDLIHPLIKIR